MGVRNWFKKSSKTFDREGFYIILFICLCIVAVTAVYISRNNANTAKRAAEGPTPMQMTEPVDKTDLVKDNDKNNQTVPAVNPPEKSNNTSSTSTNTPSSSPAVQKQENPAPTFKLAMPTEGSLEKLFSRDDLQYSQTLQQWETHEGVDIACDIGTEVKAAQSGKVVDVISDDNTVQSILKTGFGVTVIIDHGNGIRTVYSNLAEGVKVKKGDSVSKGQPIGIVGDTAVREAVSIEKSHLHFAVLKKSGKEYVPVNPETYLK